MEKTQISMEKTTDHLEKPSSLCPSLHRQCEFKSPQIRATQAVSRDQKKENWHLLFVLSPPGSIEKIQPKEPNPAFQVNILRKKKKETNLVLEMAVPLAAQLALIPLPPFRSCGAEPYLPRHARASKCTPRCESGTHQEAAIY